MYLPPSLHSSAEDHLLPHLIVAYLLLGPGLTYHPLLFLAAQLDCLGIQHQWPGLGWVEMFL